MGRKQSGWTPVKPLQRDGLFRVWPVKALEGNDSLGTLSKQRLLFARQRAWKDVEDKGKSQWISYLFLLSLCCRLANEPLFFFLNLFFVDIQLIYNVVLISAVQQTDSVVHIYTFFFVDIFFSMMVYPRISNIVPCTMYTVGPCCLSILYLGVSRRGFLSWPGKQVAWGAKYT